ncbi:ABC transporter permease [Paenibacillus sp. LMG 31456]|uniref:ABC transporter permease n=1 Tax=Paenibacillus foliorum TaxID=2654974 RepID=A0A972K230_9BACL|nr:ABC transporter permease [Paenibacillus foliorum]NOU96336.1 ABC transporter permease [Paenibacillus foliorum]
MLPTSSRKRSGIFVKRNKEAMMAFLILLIILILFAVNQNDFFTRFGPQSIFNQVITLSVASLAQTIVVLIGGIDLSIGAMIGLTNSIAATIMDPVVTAVGNEWLGIILTNLIVLAIGGMAGLINGVIIVYGRLQPIIVTLATASIFGGIALYIRPTSGGKVPEVYSSLLTGRVFTYIPISAVVMAVFIVCIWVPLRRSRLGQSFYAIGGNEYSAFVSGIRINRTKLWAYTLSGLFSACAGLLLTAQTASGDPLGSSLFTLNSIAAVVLGGTALQGGKGGYLGAVAGAAILSLILGLLIFWGVPSFYQNAVQGLILILALAIGILQRTGAKALLRLRTG